jgi:putative hemolysin
MEVPLILLLILMNGVFALSEIAVVSERTAKLQELADGGDCGAHRALALREEPGPFLSTIQVGITLVGVLMGALGEAALAEPVRGFLAGIPLLAPSADWLGLVLVVALITYLSVVLGELLPKQLALLAPERLAALVARPLGLLARIALPVVWLLSASSAALLHLDEQRIGAIMTPRNEIEALDLDQEPEALGQSLAAIEHTLVPVYRDDLDQHLLGVLRRVDLLPNCMARADLDAKTIEGLLRPAVFVPESVSSAQVLESFRDNRINMALIVDEYGGLEGLVTLADVLQAIVGAPLGDDIDDEDEVIRRADGSWLVDGSLPLDRLRVQLGIDEPLPGEDGASFHTVAGFVMHALGRIPRESESVDAAGLRFEVVDMDQQRVDKVLVARVDPHSGDAEASGRNA